MKDFLDLKDQVDSLYHAVCNCMSSTIEDIKASKKSDSDLVDIGFLCREAENTLDELRKRFKLRKELVSKLLCVGIAQRSITNPGTTNTTQGTLASASADIKVSPKIPYKGTSEYFDLLDFLGCPPEAKETLKPDWKALQQVITELTENGRPMPPGIDGTFTEYKVVYRKKKGSV